MDIAKNAAVDGKMLDIVTPEMYGSNKALYANTKTAIELEHDGKRYAMPYRNQTDDRPGIYDAGSIYFIKYPEQSEADKYDMDKLDVIDSANSSGMKEYLSKRQQLRDIESEILTDIDNVFIPSIGQNDTPEMKAMKQATILKSCDINKYAQRFGDNFLNDKRIFKGASITMNKMISIAQNLDMEVELIIRDKNPEVPNPMGKEVHAILTGGTCDE